MYTNVHVYCSNVCYSTQNYNNYFLPTCRVLRRIMCTASGESSPWYFWVAETSSIDGTKGKVDLGLHSGGNRLRFPSCPKGLIINYNQINPNLQFRLN